MTFSIGNTLNNMKYCYAISRVRFRRFTDSNSRWNTANVP